MAEIARRKGAITIVVTASDSPLAQQTTASQQVLLAAAMVALGLNVHLRSIAAVGPRPLVLGTASTAVDRRSRWPTVQPARASGKRRSVSRCTGW